MKTFLLLRTIPSFRSAPAYVPTCPPTYLGTYVVLDMVLYHSVDMIMGVSNLADVNRNKTRIPDYYVHTYIQVGSRVALE